jgi:hypothetical protein
MMMMMSAKIKLAALLYHLHPDQTTQGQQDTRLAIDQT